MSKKLSYQEQYLKDTGYGNVEDYEVGSYGNGEYEKKFKQTSKKHTDNGLSNAMNSLIGQFGGGSETKTSETRHVRREVPHQEEYVTRKPVGKPKRKVVYTVVKKQKTVMTPEAQRIHDEMQRTKGERSQFMNQVKKQL